jgi:hypothetical protein
MLTCLDRCKFVALLSLCVALMSCEFLSNSPETRAKDYLRTLIEGSGDVKRGDINSAQPDHEEIIAGLATHVAVEYLRARFVQGTSFTYTAEKTEKTAELQRLIVIRVSHPLTSVAGSEAGRERLSHSFTLSLRREASTWYVAKLEMVD